MLKKKTTFGFALACVLLGAAIAFASGYFIAKNKVGKLTETAPTVDINEQVNEVSKVIKDNYLGTINENDLVTGMCRGYVDGLGDPSIKYLTAAEYANYNKSGAGETIVYKNFGKGIGYMRFFGFEQSTKQSFNNAINDFKNSSISKVNMLVFDLRDCSTGDIEVAAQLLDLLLPEGETVAGVNKNGERTVLYTSDQTDLPYDVAIIVNGNTRGVAEIFASTLNVYGKARAIVGTTTAGDCAQTNAIALSTGDYIVIPNLYYVTKGQTTYSTTGVVPTNTVEVSAADQRAFEDGTLDLAKDMQFLAAVKALGVNDIVIPGSSDTDTDSDKAASSRPSADTDEDSGDTDEDDGTVSSGGSTASGGDSSEGVDAYWDDDDYWNSAPGDDEGNDNEDEDYDEDYYYYDEDEEE